MKRTTKHIKKTLAYLEKCWKKYPELRLCQLIVNMTTTDPFYIDDGYLIEKCKSYGKFIKDGGYKAWEKADQF